MGRVLQGKTFFLGEAGSIFERRIYLCGRFSMEISGVRSLALGAPVCWGFGHGGQDILTVS
jgi:hypothetical protein